MRKIDLTGQRFGRLVVTGPAPTVKGFAHWRVRCDCGAETVVSASNLKGRAYKGRFSGTRSCGCLMKESARLLMAQLRETQKKKIISDLRGKTFGKLTMIEPVGVKKGTMHWRAVCSCGKERVVRASGVVYGGCRSCGCDRGNPLATGEAMFNNLLKTYQLAAKRRGHSWGLSVDLFRELTRLNCHYCGGAAANLKRSKNRRGNYAYMGVDRVDSSVGYEPDNVVPCCRTCNMAKGTKPYTDFIAYLDRVVVFRKSQNPTSTSLYRKVSDGDQKDGECDSNGPHLLQRMGEDAGKESVRPEDRIN